jgi:hypothetical protein
MNELNETLSRLDRIEKHIERHGTMTMADMLWLLALTKRLWASWLRS